jgi:sulfur-oxidizing protein SoxX
MRPTYLYGALGAAAVAVIFGGCAATSPRSAADYEKEAVAVMKSSFQANGQATMDRLDQDDVQAFCSATEGKDPPKEQAAAIEKAQLATVKYPSDGKYLGDFAKGETIAQTGVGLQWSDKPGSPAGANCYACHQLTKKELSFGNMGPSLYQYGKQRGNSEQVLKYTWAKLYNAKAYNACSNMPRFGHKGILTEVQLQDVMALLLDPKSPVNQ